MGKIVDTWTLQRGWVFRSNHLTHGHVTPDAQGRPVVTIEPSLGGGAASDPTRAQADYVVEEIETSSCDHTYECHFFLDILARRLASDGTYDPNGEAIRLCLSAGQPHPLDEVELVGQMAYGGKAMTATLPHTP